MNRTLKMLASCVLAALVYVGISDTAKAQWGVGCRPVVPAYGVGYAYGYGVPNYGYSAFYGGYPGFAAPRVYTGSSLYVGPGFYGTARPVVTPFYPAYRPAFVGTPFGHVPGVRVGF